MKTIPIILTVTLLAASTLRAQVIADGATNTLSNVTTNFTGDVTIGTNGSFTLLILSDNALLTNSANGAIGLNLTAGSNEVRLISPSARWRMGGSLFVGSNGSMSRLVVSNGAFVDNSAGNLGNRVDSSNNFALVTGAGSLWSNRLDLRVGTGGRGNQLIVSNGGWVASQSGFVGNNVTSSNNFALVTGSGSVWSNALNLTVGFSGVGNRLVIEAGGLAHCDIGKVGDFGPATDNEALVTGSGSRWNVQTGLTIGRLLGGNRLIVSNGAVVWSGNGLIGNISTAPNNQVLVTGAGSVWSNQNDLIVGDFASGNVLIVSNGATVLSSNFFVGFNSSATNNRVIVDGGTLRVTNAAGTGVLDVRRGTNVLNAGLVEVDQLLLTNAAGRFVFNGGTLSVGNSIVANGQPFSVGDNVSPATLFLTGNGTHSFGNNLFVNVNATLTGGGNLSGIVSLDPGSTLRPGAPIGRLILNTPLTLRSATFMEISKNGAALTNDQIQVAGTLTYERSLTVTKLGPTALAAGDRFQLFNAGAYAASFFSFSTLTLPPLNIGLAWTNKLLVDGSIEVIQSPLFADIFGGLESSQEAAAWGDYDNDGRLDIVLNGVVYRNTGAGFTDRTFLPGGGSGGAVAWGDYDNDGWLDIVQNGGEFFPFSPTQILRNTGTGFTNINAGLPLTTYSSVAWGDYDNDGRLDIALTGASTNGLLSQVWRNTGKELTNINTGLTGEFTDIHAGLPGIFFGSAAWADYDKDGRLDIVLTGGDDADPALSPNAQILRNTGNGFTNINAGLLPTAYSSVAWGDYDNDGRLDILLTGTTNAGLSETDQIPVSQVWRNTGAGFTNINAGLPGVFRGSAAWGDYDNDGRLDILLAGGTTVLSHNQLPAPATNLICQIWRNTGSGFTNVNAGLPGVVYGSAAWGDHDNDGRLDIVLTGSTDGQGNYISQIWRNHTPLTNTPPTAPTGLSIANVGGGTMILSWNASSDAQTPASGLTYNVRIGTTPGGSDAMGPMASSTGFRRLPQMGNAQSRLFARFNAAPATTYYWSVQAVDTAFAGGPFAPEQSFTINSVFTPPNGVPVPGDINGDGVVSQSELAAVLANLNGNGILTETDLTLVLSNYFATSPWLYLTNVAGLGGTNVTFALTNSLAGAFRVEYSTNLFDWYFLGPATPRYLFTDTNAPALPQRFYRLRWP